MASVKIVPKKDWEILKEYLDAPMVVLVPEDVLDASSEEDAAIIRQKTEGCDYECDDADHWVDIAYAGSCTYNTLVGHE